MDKPTKTLQMCVGCRDDFYNDKNPMGVKRCWSFEGAEIVQRLNIGTWQNPPYNKKQPEWVMSCRHQEGRCFVKPEAIGDDGYWKH